MSRAAWQHVRHILAIRLDNLGDVLVTTSAFRAIKETRPETRLTLFASPAGAQAAELCPLVDDVIVFDAPWMDVARVLPQDPGRELSMVHELRQRRVDGALIFTSYHQSALPAAYLCYLAGIPLRHAASVDFPGTLLTSRHRFSDTAVHEVERALDLVGGVGFTAAPEMALQVPRQAVEAARVLLATRGIDASRPLALIHPGSTARSRTYAWDRYARVADLLVQGHGYQVVLTGGQDERELAARVLGRMAGKATSVAGETSFAELGALIGMADVVITNNTGPMHVASALKTPVVALFALTNPPQQWGPWRVPHRLLNYPVPCALCYAFECPTDHACLDRVEPDQVAEAALELVAERRRARVLA